MLLLFSCVRLFVTPWTRAHQPLLSSTASRSWVTFMLVASVTLSNHLVLCRPLLLLPSHFPHISVFSREYSLLMRRELYSHFNIVAYAWTVFYLCVQLFVHETMEHCTTTAQKSHIEMYPANFQEHPLSRIRATTLPPVKIILLFCQLSPSFATSSMTSLTVLGGSSNFPKQM